MKDAGAAVRWITLSFLSLELCILFFFVCVCLGRFTALSVVPGGSVFRLLDSSVGVYHFQTSGQPNSAPHRLGTNHHCYGYQQVLASILFPLYCMSWIQFNWIHILAPCLLFSNNRYFSTKLEKRKSQSRMRQIFKYGYLHPEMSVHWFPRPLFGASHC